MSHSSFFKYLVPKRKDYPMLVWPGVVGLVAALLGTYVGVNLETRRQEKEKQGIFNAKLVALSFEAARNMQIIDEINKHLSSKGDYIRELRVDAAQKVIEDFLTYKDGPPELFEKVDIMVDSIDLVNNLTDSLIEQFDRTGKYVPSTVNDVQLALEQAEGQIRNVQEIVSQCKAKYQIP